MTTYDNRESWEDLYEELKSDREGVISALKNNPVPAILDLWKLCLETASRVTGKNHPTIYAGLKSPKLRQFFIEGVRKNSIIAGFESWTKKGGERYEEEEIIITFEKFSKTLQFFTRDTISLGTEKGKNPDGKYNIYGKKGDGANNPYTSIKQLLPMLTLGIIELAGQDWLSHVDKKRVNVGDKDTNYISFSGPGSSPQLINVLTKSSPQSKAQIDNDVSEICNLLELRKNVILEGVPGTGKTRIRNEVRDHMGLEEDQMEIVTFHPASTYEEFVGGIFPFSKAGGKLLFKYQEGVLTRFANDAMKNPEKDYILFIDEINRANIPLVIGELLTIIESTKRTKPATGTNALSDGPRVVEGEPLEVAVQEPWEVAVHVEKEDKKSKYLRLPSNLYFLATMNTSDRSVVSMDAALRRRFAYYRIETKLTTEGQEEMRKALKNTVWKKKLGSGELFEQIFSVLVEVNEYLRKEIGPDAMLGHSYLFIKEDERGDLTLDEVIAEMMELNILPQIADTLTSMNKTNAVTSINKILEKIPISRLYHKLKEPTSGSLDIAVTVCKREYVKPHFTPNEADIPNDEIYILTNENSGLKIKGTNAKMVIRDNKFVVLQGSGSLAVQVVDDKKDTNYGKLKYPSIAKKREEYIDSNLIEIIDEHHGFFITDVSFKSPSTAAEFTRGTTMNGWDNNWVREKKDGSKENLEARRKELDPGYARKLK